MPELLTNITKWNVGGILRVEFPTEYRNKIWAERFGEIQNTIANLPSDIHTVEFDVSNCTWIDPIPLLSLLLSIANLRNCKINLYVPNIQDDNEESKKVLGFIYLEGFIEQFRKFNVHIYYKNNPNELTEKEISGFSLYASDLEYANCTIIRATVINLDKLVQSGNYIDDWILKMIDSIQHDIKNKIDSFSIDEVITRLRLLLSETINNVYEHAYGENKDKNVGFYVRFRNGLANNKLPFPDRYKLKAQFRKEHENSPKLERYFIDNIFSFIEIFVIDNGKGLTSNYFPINNIPDNGFSIAWNKALILGERGINNLNKKTQYGGLYTINKIIGNNYICGRDHKEWMGHSLPYKGESPSGLRIENKYQLNGLALIYRLTWDVASDIVNDWERLMLKKKIQKNEDLFNESIYYNELLCNEDIYKKYFNSNLNNVNNKATFFVIDNRFNNIEHFIEEMYKDDSNAMVDFCLYLPQRGLQKNRIYSNVKELFEKIRNKFKTLIIADIPINEANLYQLAIEGSSFTNDFIINFEKIILITQRFSVIILSKITNQIFIKKRSSSVEEKNDQYFDFNPNSFSPHLSLKHLIAWLKTHDSLLFWLRVKERNIDGSLYVNDKITWYSDDQEIDMQGYLNFAQVLTDDVLKRILENSLIRTLCLSNEYGCVYENMDILTDRLSAKMNSLFYNKNVNQIDSRQKLLIGSVSVTGLAQMNAEKQKKTNSISVPIHYFQHQGVIQSQQKAHLLLWPKEWLEKKFKKTNIDYRRVGRSHMIAPHGWKYYTIPRYRLYNNETKQYDSDPKDYQSIKNVEFHSAYECEPSLTYFELQVAGKNVIEIGHFHYENNHDLFKIDYPMIVSNSFNDGKSLAVFLLSEFLMALGKNEENIIIEPNEFLVNYTREQTKATIDYLVRSRHKFKELVRERIKKRQSNECAVIVYPYHYTTEHIVELIKMYITPDCHDRIFALIPVNKDRSCSTFLISPLTFEAIRKKIIEFKNAGKTPYALLFDEATVDGKTRKELKHLLLNLGAKEVRTLCIADRRRLPFSTTDPLKHQAYWRLDIPRLGNRDNCIICKSLEKINDFKHSLIYSYDLMRIDQWILSWESIFSYAKIKEHGLLSKPLKESITKKFSLYLNRKSGERLHYDEISLVNSTGLTLYSCEIHSMTSRDDIAVYLYNKGNLDRLTTLELLCVNLMLYGKEFSPIVVEKILKIIFIEANKSKELSNETAFAAITIMAQSPQIIETLFDNCKDKNNSDININNYDLELILSYFAQNESSKFSKSKKLVGHLKYNSYNLKSINKQFHSEIYNDYGRIHNTSLQNILNLGEDSILDKQLFVFALNTCDKLEALINNYPIWNSNDQTENPIILKNYFKDINNVKILLSKTINQNQEYEKVSYIDDKINSLKEKLTEMFENLKKLHRLFFMPVYLISNHDDFLKIEIERIIKSMNYSFKEIVISKGFVPQGFIEIQKWVNWDRQIIKKIEYLIDNTKHAENVKIKDPFNEESKSADMWISKESDNDFLILTFYNFSSIKADIVNSKTKNRIKPEKQHIFEIGGCIEYDDFTILVNGVILKTILKLPFI